MVIFGITAKWYGGHIMQTSFDSENDYEYWENHKIGSDSVKKEAYNLKEPEIQSDRDRVYQEIASNGGTTLKEIADKWGCPPNCISGRITELKQDGLIKEVGKRYLANYKGKMYPHTVYKATVGGYSH